MRHGLEAVAQAMRRFAEPWEESRHELRELHTWTLRAGRIARFEWGQDLAKALEAAGARDMPAP